MSRCHFKWPKEIEKNENLTHLILSQNYIEELPGTIEKLRKLQSLGMRWCGLSRLPPEIGNLNNLQLLDLQGNQLTEIPKEVGNLKKLVELDLSSNKLKTLPHEMMKLDKLDTLNLRFNPFSPDIPGDPIRYGAATDLLRTIWENKPTIFTAFSDIDLTNEVFISYSRKNINTARLIAELLEEAGFIVWWDHDLPTGRGFRSIIEKALRKSKCVVVLWSNESIASDWVLDEADFAKGRNTIVPILIERVSPPFGFRQLQSIQLFDWDGNKKSPIVETLLSEVKRHVSGDYTRPSPMT